MAQVNVQLPQLMHANATTPLAQALVLLVPLVLLLLHHASRIRRSSNKLRQAKRLPPSPPGLPIVGHLHLVGAQPHVSLRSLTAKHGRDGLMLLRLGTVPNLVVSSPRAAHAIMRTHDHIFASRPTSKVSDALLYGSSDIGFAPYGDHWRQVRKLVTTHLFTVKKVHSYRLARLEEVRLVMDKIREGAAASTPVDISEMMNTFANDIVCRAVSGKFFRAEGRNKLFRELIEMNSRLFGGFSLEDYFPGLAKSLGFLTCRFVSNKADEGHKRWDELLEKIISDHERRISSSKHGHAAAAGAAQEESDFIHVLLSVQQDYGITRDHIKAILIDMFGAGTDTSSLVLELAMAELMRNPQLMTKLQSEVRKNTPKGQEMVEEDNLAGMAYLRAVVKETLRLHPPAPLLVPHLSMAACDIDGYTIPSGTRVTINAWAISRDPESWEKPEEFMPERFMDGGSAATIDFKGKNFEFVPFGAGRRICPGQNLGLATVEIMLANLMYCFDWGLPAGMEKEDIDMTEVFGLTVHPKEKLILVPKFHES
ncbi:indole-2-monooxygenase-like [Phragmites australis]|uniref:indole-2-monooxygenase-like n=1 Tax=Phragmites australis TaxID=29695 RepID=UPI002D778ADF|nr:indole-2-monooxygenase-like [Phragmites australis]